MMKCSVVLAALLALVVLAEAHYRSNSRNNYNRNNYNRNNYNRNNYRQPFFPGVYSWSRNLGRNRHCHEYAYAQPGGNVIYGTSTDEILPSVGVTPASSVYDFSNAVPIGVIAPVDGPCYYSNSSLDLGQTIGNLSTINNTQIPDATAVPLDGTGAPLTSSEVLSIYAAYPSVESVCEGRQVIPVYPQGAAPVPYTGPTDTVKVFTLNTAASLRVRRPSRNRHSHHRHSHHRHG